MTDLKARSFKGQAIRRFCQEQPEKLLERLSESL